MQRKWLPHNLIRILPGYFEGKAQKDRQYEPPASSSHFRSQYGRTSGKPEDGDLRLSYMNIYRPRRRTDLRGARGSGNVNYLDEETYRHGYEYERSFDIIGGPLTSIRLEDRSSDQ
jgi:hypothetical protein